MQKPSIKYQGRKKPNQRLQFTLYMSAGTSVTDKWPSPTVSSMFSTLREKCKQITQVSFFSGKHNKKFKEILTTSDVVHRPFTSQTSIFDHNAMNDGLQNTDKPVYNMVVPYSKFPPFVNEIFPVENLEIWHLNAPNGPLPLVDKEEVESLRHSFEKLNIVQISIVTEVSVEEEIFLKGCSIQNMDSRISKKLVEVKSINRIKPMGEEKLINNVKSLIKDRIHITELDNTSKTFLLNTFLLEKFYHEENQFKKTVMKWFEEQNNHPNFYEIQYMVRNNVSPSI
ncbi:uncharacterized protein NDAI_0G00210 [Naumovozyma dairenensis CBS 421]|uniref:Uncharacterized protein n=1 Tax=Naumovozyma dairenensis (strain ATCC 10597 / BCRC 20456 / CBS 421 / NBRC 0211 / NRRL Y-12639) TaxID=1071378 RepID=G0WDD6_NAUDC|nr:hypothetical protein NDAI_0G00210 [Naumovozyma dairenensis CBS 421]CCD25797.2 hypothetical protein NDAI_0G00210 [Naumovozyma dairenensis CBS 421]